MLTLPLHNEDIGQLVIYGQALTGCVGRSPRFLGYLLKEFLTLQHFMIVAVFARLFGNPFNQFLMDPLLVDGQVVLNILALEATAVGHHAPIARFFVSFQEERFFRGFDGLVGISFKVFDQLRKG